MEEVVPKVAHRSGSDAGQSGRGESGPAEDVRRRCMKNSLSVLSCICKRTKENCDRGSEVRTVLWSIPCGVSRLLGLVENLHAPIPGKGLGSTTTTKSRQFTADKTGESQFLRGNRRNLAGEGVVRKISSHKE